MGQLGNKQPGKSRARAVEWRETQNIYLSVGPGIVPDVSAVSVLERADTLATTLSCSFRIVLYLQPKNFLGKNVCFSTHFLNEFNEMLQLYDNIHRRSVECLCVCNVEGCPQDTAANTQDCGYWKWTVSGRSKESWSYLAYIYSTLCKLILFTSLYCPFKGSHEFLLS